MRCPPRWTLAWMGLRLFSLSLHPARVTSPEPPGQLSPEPRLQGGAVVIWVGGRGGLGPGLAGRGEGCPPSRSPALPSCCSRAVSAPGRPGSVNGPSRVGSPPHSSGTYLLLLAVTQGGPLGPLGRESSPRGARARPCCVLRSPAPAPTLGF